MTEQVQVLLNRIIIGDCLDVLPSLAGKCIGATLTSPPFKDEDIPDPDYYEWFQKVLREVERVTIDYALVFNNPTRLVEICARTKPDRVLMWCKSGPGVGVVQYAWRYEPVFVYRFSTARYKINRYIWSDVLPYSPILHGKHRYENPVRLYQHLAKYLRKSETVLDPFIGSGTTALACRAVGLQWLGIEKDASCLPIIESKMRQTLISE